MVAAAARQQHAHQLGPNVGGGPWHAVELGGAAAAAGGGTPAGAPAGTAAANDASGHQARGLSDRLPHPRPCRRRLKPHDEARDLRPANMEVVKAARFGGGQETEAQLAARFGSGQQTEALGRLTGRKNLKQTNPVFYTGSWRHGECGVITIERAAGRPDGKAVNVECTVCKHNTTISIKKWRLKEVIDLCDSLRQRLRVGGIAFGGLAPWCIWLRGHCAWVMRLVRCGQQCPLGLCSERVAVYPPIPPHTRSRGGLHQLASHEPGCCRALASQVVAVFI